MLKRCKSISSLILSWALESCLGHGQFAFGLRAVGRSWVRSWTEGSLLMNTVLRLGSCCHSKVHLKKLKRYSLEGNAQQPRA